MLLISELCIIKYKPNGDSVWVRRNSGLNNSGCTPSKMSIDNNKNIYVTGTSGSDFFTVKYDSNGVLLWSKSYNGPGNDNDNPTSIEIDNGYIYVAGSSYGSGTNSDFAL
ncbi:MAG: SBBP repeat-containing protein [Ignavibacteria bacterium]|nr:SBBP repeat-containing protein [Ignavibacteria bacterium]